MNNMESSKGEIVMYQLNDVVKLDVRLEDETVWLTQQQMSELFSVKENTVTYHIKEIYKTEELEKEGTARKIWLSTLLFSSITISMSVFKICGQNCQNCHLSK